MSDKTIHARLIAAQPELKDAYTDRVNTHLRSKYATLKSILEAVREPLNKHGLFLTFGTDICGEGQQFLQVTAAVADETGATAAAAVYYPYNVGWNPQQANAAITYGKKAAALALLGITSTEEDESDDDGESLVTPPAAISQEQADQIVALLQDVKGTDDTFQLCQGFGKKELQELNADEADRAIKALKAAKARKGGAK